MMNKFVKSILDPIGVPVANKTYLGSEQTYIIFNIWSIPGLHADDMEIQTDYTVQIDIFSPGNLTNLAKQAKNRMIAAGFMRSYENEEYVEEAKLFRKIFRFKYSKEAE
jgi:hypothetical protein